MERDGQLSRWRLRSCDSNVARSLAEREGLTATGARILSLRGISTAEEAGRFLAPSLAHGGDPFAMKGMAKAVEVLVSCARRGDKIVIFGDYDVDGVTAVAQLRAVFRSLGADSVPFLPHRVRDGYGLRPETFRKVFQEHRPRAIVTVDCGITAVEAVAEAAAQGVSVVITDHHLPPDVLPAGASVVNPKQPGCGYPFKELCGAGVAFKIAQAIVRREGLTLSERSLAKVAALGTVSDMVPLLGENRAIVAEGLAGLSNPRSPGLRALLAESGVAGRAPTAEDVGFRIGPRLNAAGRMDTADLALAVLEERRDDRARDLARQLTERNAERQTHERRVVEEARTRFASRPELPAVLIAQDSAWPRGVLGIAASRLAREHHRPVLLFSVSGDRAVGSGRSVEGVPLHALLSQLPFDFLEFGGHEQACGATIEAARLDAFREAAEEFFAAKIPDELRIREIAVDAEVPLEEAAEALLADVERMEPFGLGNPRPVLLSRGLSTRGSLRPLGSRGVRGRLARGSCSVSAIAWEPGGRWGALSEGTVDALYHLRRDRYSGSVEIEILDLRPAAA